MRTTLKIKAGMKTNHTLILNRYNTANAYLSNQTEEGWNILKTYVVMESPDLVRLVNAHDDLLASLKRMVSDGDKNAVEEAKRVIAKAEGSKEKSKMKTQCDEKLANGIVCGNTHLISNGKCSVHWKTEISHTPTPWHIKELTKDGHINAKGPLSFDGCGINGPDEFKTRLCTFVDKNTEAKKYGPLFAAAPELLAALMAVLKTMYAAPEKNMDMITGCSTTVKNAIAKAEGK